VGFVSQENETNVIESLRQTEQLKASLANGQGEWTVICDSRSLSSSASVGRFATFSKPQNRPNVLSQTGWDLTKGEGLPGFSQSYSDGKVDTIFERSTVSEFLEPILLFQDFHGLEPGRYLLNQTFVLVMRLWEDPESRNHYELRDDGSKELAVEYVDSQIRVRTRLLLRYQAARQLDLLLFTDATCKVESRIDTASLDEMSEARVLEDGLAKFDLAVGLSLRSDGFVFSRLLVKKILPPPPHEASNIWPWIWEETDFPKFTVSEDEVGRPIRHTCDPEQLADYFGKNPASANYMTPVFFRADVLQKYYDNPVLYEIQSGYLRCGALWRLHIDNYDSTKVMVALGDLGRDLPESERNYWLAHNISPLGMRMSDEYQRTSFLGQWTESSSPSHRFKQAYEELSRSWERNWGWRLYRDSAGDDVHLLTRLRVPLNDNIPEYEAQSLILAKLMVDQLNEAKLTANLSKIEREKGIQKFERFATSIDYPHTARDASLLRRIYGVRSRNAAHAGGSGGKKYLEGLLQGRTRPEYFGSTLEECTKMLLDLSKTGPRPVVE
jgi:hypothetical protein